ncbi:MAG: glycosyltransferase family 2 protein, partial [Leptolyngbyaceae cyanobacterium]
MSVSSSPTVSVLMPVFNGEQYLEQAVNSILTQTFKDFECILINDGSTDRSAEILARFQAKDERVRLISHENKGLISVLNEGLACAKGDY